MPDLHAVFAELNRSHFGGTLAVPKIFWNTRLRTSAGRFFPGRRQRGLPFFSSKRPPHPPSIEIARYLLEEPNGQELVRMTLGHEMIHYWLWLRGRPCGHTDEFKSKMREMKVPRYNPVPRKRQAKYVYSCPECRAEFSARRRWRNLACAACCKAHAGGKYDARFRLELKPERGAPQLRGGLKK